jgi:hypothetical protein
MKESAQQPANPNPLMAAPPEDFNVEFGSFGSASIQNEISDLVEGVRRQTLQPSSGGKPSFLDVRISNVLSSHIS